jgi:predicted N-acetyltransferase YhbS
MALTLAPATPAHVSELGRICYEAFKHVSERHGFESDFQSADFARMVWGMLVQREDIYTVAAFEDGRPVGSNGLLVSDGVGGVGPITVEVAGQGNGTGRRLMEDVLDYARQNGIEMVRLLQDSFNMASLSLYASLGFDTRAPVAVMRAAPAAAADRTVRPLTEADLPVVEELSRRIYKISRRNEIAASMRPPFQPLVRERGGRITGYYSLGMIGHGVAEAEDDLVALVGQAARGVPEEIATCLCPLVEGDLYRKLMAAGCRTRKVMNLMTLGPYEAPDGPWLCSVGF